MRKVHVRQKIRSVRDNARHRRIARSNPLARIPEVLIIEKDVYHSVTRPARTERGRGGAACRPLAATT